MSFVFLTQPENLIILPTGMYLNSSEFVSISWITAFNADQEDCETGKLVLHCTWVVATPETPTGWKK